MPSGTTLSSVSSPTTGTAVDFGAVVANVSAIAYPSASGGECFASCLVLEVSYDGGLWYPAAVFSVGGNNQSPDGNNAPGTGVSVAFPCRYARVSLLHNGVTNGAIDVYVAGA